MNLMLALRKKEGERRKEEINQTTGVGRRGGGTKGREDAGSPKYESRGPIGAPKRLTRKILHVRKCPI